LISCRDIDLIKYIEKIDISEKEEAHLKECKNCQAELMQLKHTINIINQYFKHAFDTDCPHIETLTAQIIHSGTLTDPVLNQHAKTCPACSQSRHLLEEFDNDIGEPTVSEIIPLPESLKKMIRFKRVGARTRLALEKLMDKSTKTKNWIKEVVEQSIDSPQIQGAPAARDDLTHGQDEAPPPDEISSEPDDTENDKD
jgi:DNA repair exonuclease SbcCD ATPase subunit